MLQDAALRISRLLIRKHAHVLFVLNTSLYRRAYCELVWYSRPCHDVHFLLCVLKARYNSIAESSELISN